MTTLLANYLMRDERKSSRKRHVVCGTLHYVQFESKRLVANGWIILKPATKNAKTGEYVATLQLSWERRR